MPGGTSTGIVKRALVSRGNGSGDRRPANRASVELVFDNSLGKAAGAWSQYAEIAIKRVLERDGQSTYFINNTAVRRRDVTDIFLGTGLGARAYAIVEQRADADC